MYLMDGCEHVFSCLKSMALMPSLLFTVGLKDHGEWKSSLGGTLNRELYFLHKDLRWS
jgi:hypothetical protein